jgi:hypothetical protein
MNTKIAVLVSAFLVFLSACVTAKPAALPGLMLESLEVRSAQDSDDPFRVTASCAEVFVQRDHLIIGNEWKPVTGLSKIRWEGSCLMEQTAFMHLPKSIYPIEKVGVIARSVTFPSVLDHGQAIIDTKYPNVSIFCMNVANYSGLVTGLIWSMDRELVEEYGLQDLIDRATMVIFPCALMFLSPEVVKQQTRQGLAEEHATTRVQIGNPDGANAASRELNEKTPAMRFEDAQKIVVTQIEKIQVIIRFAETVKSKQDE